MWSRRCPIRTRFGCGADPRRSHATAARDKLAAMSTLQDQVTEDLKAAMKARDEVAKRTLRMLKSDLGNKELELGRDLDDEDALKVLTGAVKTRKDSVVEYDKAGRADLVESEQAELEVLAKYLPEPLDEAEAEAAIAKIIEELGATEKKQMGQVMKEVMARHRGEIDGKLASRLAGKLLS